MASEYTSIVDLVGVEPKVLGQTVDLLIKKTNPLINSGVAVTGHAAVHAASGGSNIVSIPFMRPLDSTRFNSSNDNVASMGETSKQTAGEFATVRHNLNNGFAYADLTSMITLYQSRGGVAAALAQYWNEIGEYLSMTSMKGAVGSDANLTIGATETADFSLNLVIDACASAGVNRKRFKNLIVSPTTGAKIDKRQVIANIAGSEVNLNYTVHGGFRVIESADIADDEAYVAADGAFAFANVNAPNMIPLEVARTAAGGGGGGAEALWTRRSLVAHPQGFRYVAVSSGGTVAAEKIAVDSRDMADSTRWARAVPVSDVPFRRFMFDQD